jgi:GTP cyclohydrolase IA
VETVYTTTQVLEPALDRPAVELAVSTLLTYVGEDPTRQGLEDTPGRVAKAWLELTRGYSQDPATILGKTFDVRADEMVLLRNIEFCSTCEHHLLPFTGTVTIGYLPAAAVVGISKLARLVDCFSRRLQVQERMTSQIAEAIMDHLHPLGAGVVVKGRHLCMGIRGVQKPNTEMVTSSLLGKMREPAVRAEFLHLAEER